MKEKIDKIRFLVEQLKKRKEMYIFDNSYTSLVSFLVGYFLGVRDVSNFDFSISFQEWLRAKDNDYFAIHWSAYIFRYKSNKNEILAEKILIELLEEFINSLASNK